MSETLCHFWSSVYVLAFRRKMEDLLLFNSFFSSRQAHLTRAGVKFILLFFVILLFFATIVISDFPSQRTT